MINVSLNLSKLATTTTSHTSGQYFATVAEGMFGGVFVNSANSTLDVFAESYHQMGLSHVRWTGGAIVEGGVFSSDGDHLQISPADFVGSTASIVSSGVSSAYIYDLSYPELIAPELLNGRQPLTGLTDALRFAVQNDSTFEMTLPTVRYVTAAQDDSFEAPESSLGRAKEDVLKLLNDIFVDGTHSNTPKEIILDIGNENLVWAKLDPDLSYDSFTKFDPTFVLESLTKYFSVCEQYLSAVSEFRSVNPDIDFKIAIQIPFMNDQPGEDDPASVFLRLLQSLPTELSAQIDMVRIHSLTRDYDASERLENWYSDEISRVVGEIEGARGELGRPGDVAINVSAWSSTASVDISDVGSYSLRAAASLIAHFSSLVEIGADYASAWGIAINYRDEVQLSSFDPVSKIVDFTASGETLRMLSETLIGTTLVSDAALFGAGADNPFQVHTFVDDSKVVILISAGDISPDGEVIDLCFDQFYRQVDYVWAESISQDIGIDGSQNGNINVWNPLIGATQGGIDGAVDLRFGDSSITVGVVSDYEVIRLVVALEGAGDGALYLIGDSRHVENIFDDSLSGGSADDTLLGVLGNDTIVGNEGDDRVDGGSGRDLLIGGDGDDTISGGVNSDTIRAGSGCDVAYGGLGRDLVYLDGGDDIFWDNGQTGDLGRDTVHGGLGNDTINGGGGADLIYGDAGDDSLVGGQGDDTLYGGTGEDTFVFLENSAADVIADFESGVDVLRLSAELWGGANLSGQELLERFSTLGSTGVFLDFGNGNTISLHGLFEISALYYDLELV